MKKYCVISLAVIVSVGIFASVGSSWAGEDQGSRAILDGAKQVMDGYQKITAVMEKKEITDPELTAAQRQRPHMITVIVQFKLPKPITREAAREAFLNTATNYKDFPGLIRKYYGLSQDGGTVAGIYLWNSKADSDKLYTQNWKSFATEKYGTEPSLTYFECPVVVDNLSHEVITDD